MDGDTDSEVEETHLMGENGSPNFNEQSTGDNTSLPSITVRNGKSIDTSVPKDQLHIIYIITILVSAGILFPWNSYISAIDYFKFLYPTQRVENVIPYTYMSLTLFSVVFTIGSINLFPLHGRIAFGYIIYFLVLLFIPLLDIGIHNCSVTTDIGFGLTVLSVVLVALGSGGKEYTFIYVCTYICTYIHTYTVLVYIRVCVCVYHLYIKFFYLLNFSSTIQLLWSSRYVATTIHAGSYDGRECGWIFSLNSQNYNQSIYQVGRKRSQSILCHIFIVYIVMCCVSGIPMEVKVCTIFFDELSEQF